jgi:hypothetical protein
MTQTGVAQERTLANFQPSRLSPAQRKARIPREATDQRRKGSWGLTMRLSDAGARRRKAKLIYPNHRLPPWLNEDVTRDRSNRLLEACAAGHRRYLRHARYASSTPKMAIENPILAIVLARGFGNVNIPIRMVCPSQINRNPTTKVQAADCPSRITIVPPRKPGITK